MQFLAYFILSLFGSLVDRKFQTRKKCAEAFDKLQLDWISGIGLAFVIVAGWCLLVLMFCNYEIAHGVRKF